MSVHLLDAELRRFFARRTTRGVLAAALLIVVAVNIAQALRSDVVSHRSIGSLYTAAPQCRLEPSDPGFEGRYTEQCLQDAGIGYQVFDVQGALPPAVTEGPAETHIVQIERPVDRRVHIAHSLRTTFVIIGAPMMFASVLLASTFLAADFGTSIGTQLLFEPRRRLVYLTKTLAVMLGNAIVVFIVAMTAALLQYLASVTIGVSSGLTGDWFAHRAADLGRIMLVAALAAPLGLAIAALAKRTVAAVAIFFGMYIVSAIVGNQSWGKGIAKQLPVTPLIASMANNFKDGSTMWFGLHTLSESLLWCSLYAALATVLTMLWFDRREVR